jgi:hypothetical protein
MLALINVVGINNNNNNMEGLNTTMLVEGITCLEEAVEGEALAVVVVQLPSGLKKTTLLAEVVVLTVVDLTLPEDTVLPLVVGMEIPLMQGSLISLQEEVEVAVGAVGVVVVVIVVVEGDVAATIMMSLTLLDMAAAVAVV